MKFLRDSPMASNALEMKRFLLKKETVQTGKKVFWPLRAIRSHGFGMDSKSMVAGIIQCLI